MERRWSIIANCCNVRDIQSVNFAEHDCNLLKSESKDRNIAFEMSISTFESTIGLSGYSLTLSLESEEHHYNILKPPCKDRTLLLRLVFTSQSASSSPLDTSSLSLQL